MPPRRSVLLRVYAPDETAHPVWLTGDVPATRADCPPSRHRTGYCGAVRCSKHLWFLAGADRAGRRVRGKAPAATLRNLTWPLPPSCSLDVADATRETGESLSIEAVARATGIKPSRIFDILRLGLAKLRGSNIDPELAGQWPQPGGGPTYWE